MLAWFCQGHGGRRAAFIKGNTLTPSGRAGAATWSNIGFFSPPMRDRVSFCSEMIHFVTAEVEHIASQKPAACLVDRPWFPFLNRAVNKAAG